tara:strand:- start:26 stop:184 length:159 start_codon:yes stop_codon:yes gene_type:complete
MQYDIIRFYENGRKRTMDSGLTLEEAKEHCSDPATAGWTRSGVRFFDGYTAE